jgi:hypothetical protein
MSTSNGSTHDNGHAADEMIDQVYSFWPGLAGAPQPLPEAAFSITLKGHLGGQEALLTARRPQSLRPTWKPSRDCSMRSLRRRRPPAPPRGRPAGVRSISCR